MMIHSIHSFVLEETIVHAPLSLESISAGFPSPAENYLDRPLDLNELMIAHPTATFFVRVSGDSMKNAGICHNDILVVDRSREAQNNDIIVAILFGEFTVKRWVQKGTHAFLEPENPQYPTITITEESDFEIWGVVTYAIHTLHPHPC
jgi:DNA polymerase V